jgi:predicted metal-dependent hydrolase
MRLRSTLLALTLVCLLAGSASAHEPGIIGVRRGIDRPGQPRVAQLSRREQPRLQNRFTNQIKNGQLTTSESKKLEKQKARLTHDLKRDMAKDGGNLSEKHQDQLNREANRLSVGLHKNKRNKAGR